MAVLTRPEGSEPQDFHLSRRGVASLFFAGFAVSAFSAQAAPISTDAVGLITSDEMIPVVDSPLPAYVARPNANCRPPLSFSIGNACRRSSSRSAFQPDQAGPVMSGLEMTLSVRRWQEYLHKTPCADG